MTEEITGGSKEVPSDVVGASCPLHCSTALACNCGSTDIHAIYPSSVGKTVWPPRPSFWECQVCFARYRPDHFDHAFTV